MVFNYKLSTTLIKLQYFFTDFVFTFYIQMSTKKLKSDAIKVFEAKAVKLAVKGQPAGAS